MTRHVNRTRKYVGWFCSTFGIALIILGLIIYLNGPSQAGTALWGYKDSYTTQIQPHKFVDYPYKLSLPEAPHLILQVQTNASITVKQGQGIKAYFMNETQYSKLKNDTRFSEEIEELSINLDNISFQPRSNVTYYIVLTNIANETAAVSIKISTFYTIQVFDYALAFKGLESALIGGAMFTASFIFENPFDKIIRRGLRSPIFPGVKSYLSEKDPTITTIAWGALGIITLCILYFLLPPLNEMSTSGFPPPLIPLIQDALIRLGLFFFFAFSLTFAIYVLVVGFCYNAFRNFLYWFFGVRYRRSYNVKLAERASKFWLKEMVSPLSLVVYVVIAGLTLGIYQNTKDILTLLITVLMPFMLLSVYNISVSYRKVFIDEKELEQMGFFIHVDIVSSMIMSGLFMLVLFFNLNLFLDRIYAETVGSSVLVSLTPLLSEFFVGFLLNIVDTISAIKGLLILLTECVLVAGYSLLLFLIYYRRPVETRKAKVKVQVFSLTFISVQLILAMTQQSLVSATITSIAISLAVSFLSILMDVSWSRIIVKLRRCPKCKKELSSFPEAPFCPYCGEALGSQENNSARKSLI